MGFALNGGKTGCEVHVGYRTTTGIADGPGGSPQRTESPPGVADFNRIPINTRLYTFDFLYDPEGGGGAARSPSRSREGPLHRGPFRYQLRRLIAKAARLRRFRHHHPLTAGGPMAAWFDDLTIDGRRNPSTAPPHWLRKTIART